MEIIENAESATIHKAIQNIKDYDIKAGRPPKYSDDEIGLEQFKQDTLEYFEDVYKVNNSLDADQKPVVINIESWVTGLGLTRETLMKYHRRGGSWGEFIDFVKEVILSCKLQRYQTGQVPPVTAIFDLCNNHGFYSTSEYKRLDMNKPDNTVQTIEYPVLLSGKLTK